MAPTTPSTDDILLLALKPRDSRCPPGYPYYSYGLCLSAWDYYGRWIFCAAVIFCMILLALACACVTTRRRRRQGMRPMYGTGWMAPGGPPPPHQNWAGQQPPPPAYGAPSYPMNPQAPSNTYPSAEGYYGGQYEGVSPPKNVYGGAGQHDDYAPPAGPPPSSSRP